jgi:hypothetical protein
LKLLFLCRGESFVLFEISSSHGGEYEVQSLLRCTAMFLNGFQPTFQRLVLPLIALIKEAANTSETSVEIQIRTRQYIPEDSELQLCFKLMNWVIHFAKINAIHNVILDFLTFSAFPHCDLYSALL